MRVVVVGASEGGRRVAARGSMNARSSTLIRTGCDRCRTRSTRVVEGNRAGREALQQAERANADLL